MKRFDFFPFFTALRELIHLADAHYITARGERVLRKARMGGKDVMEYVQQDLESGEWILTDEFFKQNNQ